MTVEDDVVTLIKALNPPMEVFNSFEAATRDRIPGIEVAQRETSGYIDSIAKVDTLFVDVTVRGATGEAGRLKAATVVADLYGEFILQFDTVVNGTTYIRIYPDSVPFRIISADGKRCDFQFGLELKRIIR